MGPPPPTSWEVLTELVVPIIGIAVTAAAAIATLVVAVVAVRVSRESTRIAEAAYVHERETAGAIARQDLADRVLEFLNDNHTDIVQGGHGMRPPPDLLRDAAVTRYSASELVEWVSAAGTAIGEQFPIASTSPDTIGVRSRQRAYVALEDELARRLQVWVADGSPFEPSPFVPPNSES